MRPYRVSLVVILFVSAMAAIMMAQTPTPAVKPSLKRNLAVYGFEDKTDHKIHWYSGQNVGEGMSDMLTTALVKSGKFRIFERSQLESVMQEQGLGMSGAVVEQTAAQAGRLLGAELIVMGAVTEFGAKREEGGVSIKRIKIGAHTLSATVAVDVRLVDANSGEIKWSNTVRKEETKTGLSFAVPDFSFNDQKQFDESLIGKATRAAIDEIVQKLTARVGTVPWEALVATTAGDDIFLNQGFESGLQPDMVLSVYRQGEQVTDPATGEVLFSTEEKIGAIKVVDPSLGNGKAARCAVVEGEGFQRGDVARFEE
jgi:curli biogenesis system outer membrane secretion channel CsgG